MTMQRRTLGRGRALATLAGIVLFVACIPRWWLVAGEGLPAIEGNAFDGAGIVVFVVAIATLFLVALPYAAGDRPVALDRLLSFAALAIAGWLGFAIRIVDLASKDAFVFREPAEVVTNGPGLWLAGIGLVILTRAAYEIAQEPRYR